METERKSEFMEWLHEKKTVRDANEIVWSDLLNKSPQSFKSGHSTFCRNICKEVDVKTNL